MTNKTLHTELAIPQPIVQLSMQLGKVIYMTSHFKQY